MPKSRLESYDISQATHALRCAHQIGRSRNEYSMPCIPLGKTKSGFVKVVVFGDRDWKNKDHVKRIRYVPSWKLKKAVYKEKP